jgi:nucleoside diphosphate kinase
MEHWFAILIIKPDALQHRRDILQHLTINGFNVQKARILTAHWKAIELLSDKPGPSIRTSFITHMAGRSIMIMRLHARNPAHNPIDRLTVLLGNEDPMVAKRNQEGDSEEWNHSLRAKFGTDIIRNAFYASKSWESSICDAAIFDMY